MDRLRKVAGLIARNEYGFLYFLIFTIIYFTLSVYRHLSFQSGSLDLGAYSQTAWLISNFKDPVNTILDYRHFLGNHFDLIIPVVSVFYKLAPSPIFLLFLQSVFVASMVIPATLIYEMYAKRKVVLYHILMLTLLINIPVLNTILYDFRTFILGASLVMWMFYFFEVKKYTGMFALLFIMLLTRESVGPFGVFFALYIISRKEYRIGAFVLLLSAAQFIIAQAVVLPMFMGGESIHLQYNELGESLSDIVKTLITNPALPISILLRPEFLSYYITTFMRFPLIVLTPMAWLLLIPNFLERFLSSKQAMWGDSFHYAFILAPIAIYISIISLSKLKLIFKRSIELDGRFILAIIVLPAFLFNLSQVLFSPISRMTQLNSGVEKTLRDYRRATIEFKNHIPKDASVSAQDNFIPHLANREKIYKLNMYNSSEYIIFDSRKSYWPLTADEYRYLLEKVEDSDSYKRVNDDQNILIYKKVGK